MNEELRLRLHRSMAAKPPRLPGKRSMQLAQQIAAIPEEQRTLFQRRMFATHERGECIGCNHQGEPLGIGGNELPVRREQNGFAAPVEFCDCVEGVRFQKLIERQRKEYIQQDIHARQIYAQRLFGLSSVMQSSTQEWTLKTWPIDFASLVSGLASGEIEFENEDEKVDYLLAVSSRRFLVDLLNDYVEKLHFEFLKGSKRGLCLIGAPGVGKTGLIRSIEPLLASRGHFMLSLYIPDLLRLVKQSNQVEEMIRMMKTVEILFLDDLGNPLIAEPISAEIHSLFACVFDERLKYNRPTFITTNLDENVLEIQFGQYLLSRIQGLCHIYAVPGIDLR